MMPRRMVVVLQDGSVPVLQESAAHDEAQLQRQLKMNPDLLPLEDFGLAGPPMVVGRETALASGAVDLVLLARGGEIVLAEFKTGPQNPDFRAALAQLLDYGSDLWRLTYEEFERSVLLRYLASHHAHDSPLRGCQSLLEATTVAWADAPLSEAESALFRDRVSSDLALGAFHYVVVAQRFTPAMEATARYLNAAMPKARHYLVELVRFHGAGMDVFEARTVLRPDPIRRAVPTGSLSREVLLGDIADDEYRAAIERLLDAAESLGLDLYWGRTGMSWRLRVPGNAVPVSIAWLFPPGVVGWMGLSDLNLGYDPASPGTVGAEQALSSYVEGASRLAGTRPTAKGGLTAFVLSPDSTIAVCEQIVELVEQLVTALTG